MRKDAVRSVTFTSALLEYVKYGSVTYSLEVMEFTLLTKEPVKSQSDSKWSNYLISRFRRTVERNVRGN